MRICRGRVYPGPRRSRGDTGRDKPGPYGDTASLRVSVVTSGVSRLSLRSPDVREAGSRMDEAGGKAGPRSGLVSDVAQLRVFVAVVETGSFSAAARRLGLTPPSISRQVRHFEERLGVRLVART